jgi:glycosyltransferase involved in cell wall biosynthesis
MNGVLKFYQAMQLKTPVLVRNVPGNADVVTDYKTGLVFDSPEVYN